MRLFFFVIVFIFNTQISTKADDIKEFEIEGLTIGNSLLNFFSEEDIKKSDMNYYKKKEYKTVAFNNSPIIKTYDWLQITYKTNDRKYNIVSVDGVLSFKNNYKDCLVKKEKISKEIQSSFNIIPDNYGGPHAADKSGKSIFETTEWRVDNGLIIVQCIDWSKEMEKQYFDHLKVWTGTYEFFNWVSNNPY